MSRARQYLVAFVVAYMAMFGTSALMRGNTEFLFYFVVMLVLIGAVVLMDRRVHFSSGTLWALGVWGFLHMAGGNVLVPATGEVLYNLWLWAGGLKYDQVVHAYGFATATFAAHEALRAAVGPAYRVRLGVAFALVCIGMGLGALNEVVEFVAVLTIPSTNVGGYENTGWDLVFNLFGCIAAATLIWINAKDQAGWSSPSGERESV